MRERLSMSMNTSVRSVSVTGKDIAEHGSGEKPRKINANALRRGITIGSGHSGCFIFAMHGSQ